MAKKRAQKIEWPADKVERRPVSSLIEYARNPRIHSDAQVKQIAASITEFGFTMPCLVDEGGVLIAGHGRVLAARLLGLADVPVIVARGWTDAQKSAYRIADNQLTLASQWDNALLASELGDLQLGEFDLSLIGFDSIVLENIMQSAVPIVPSVSLANRFGIVPFSVFNAREGWWQNRKRAWIGLGMQPELGRGETPDTVEKTASFKSQGRLTALQKTGDSRVKTRHRPNAVPGRGRMPLDRIEGRPYGTKA